MHEHRRYGDGRSWRWQTLLKQRGLLADGGGSPASGLRIKRIEMGPGQITATVLHDRQGECDVSVEMSVWQDEEWASVIGCLSRQALFVAQMLAGDLPDELEATLQAEGLALLPAPQETVTAFCSCCQAADARCPHLTVVLRSAGEMLADDPWLLFLLRGRVRQQVLRSLRRKRGQNGDRAGAAQAGRTPQIGSVQAFSDRHDGQRLDAEVRPLLEEIHSFWGSSRIQEQFRPHIVRPSAKLVLLRRLGPPAFSHANAEVFDALSAIYRRVGEAALALAYAEDPAPDESETESVGE